MRSRKFMLAAGVAGVLAILATGQAALHQNIIGSANAQAPGAIMVPVFQADGNWPKPLPNGWVIGSTIGLAVDTKDNVWIVHRPGTLAQKESYLTRHEADCCTAAPDVLEFDQKGNLMHHFGQVAGHDWPSSNHGVTVDKAGNVWLGANGAAQPGPPAGSAEQFAPRRPAAPGATPGAEGGGEAGRYHDSFILKFSQDGQFLGEIGTANGSRGSLDTENVRGVAQIRFLPDGTLVAADGYGNHRVSEWDPVTMKLKRMWGAYGKPPSDDPIPHYNPDSPQFGNPVHCAEPSGDGLIYVCDRTNNRIQVFKFDGSYVNQYPIEVDSRGDGSAWEIAFSRDAAQKYMYISDGTNEKIHVWDRASMKELYWFGGGGRQPGQFYAVHSIVTDSKGDIFTTETYEGKRVQKFLYKGLKPLSQVLAMKTTGNSMIGEAKP
jgi:sugar lactone lactonase YvrE